MAQLMRRFGFVALGFALPFLAIAAGTADAARPALDAPAQVRQGEHLILVASPHGKRRCSLVTLSPGGRQSAYRVTGRRRGAHRDLRVALRVDRGPGCSSSYCRYLVVKFKNFSSGKHSIKVPCQPRQRGRLLHLQPLRLVQHVGLLLLRVSRPYRLGDRGWGKVEQGRLVSGRAEIGMIVKVVVRPPALTLGARAGRRSIDRDAPGLDAAIQHG